jgi:hypothetical protein
LEAYFESIGVKVRPYDGARIHAINGVDAAKYLTDLASRSSIYDGLVAGYESLDPRYMRLMTRYSADTSSGLFTQEVGRFGQRSFYPGADSVTVQLQTSRGIESVVVPWAATFAGKGNTTASFISETCSLAEEENASSREAPSPMSFRRKAVTAPDAQLQIRAIASSSPQNTPQTNHVQPNRKQLLC